MLLLQAQSSGEAGPPAPPFLSFCLAVSPLCPPQEVVCGGSLALQHPRPPPPCPFMTPALVLAWPRSPGVGAGAVS